MITIIGNGAFGNSIFNKLNNSIIWDRKSPITDNIIIISVPIHAFREVYSSIANEKKQFIITTKGIDNDGLYPSEILLQILKAEYAILGGANLSKEINCNMPTYSILESNYNMKLHLNNWYIIYKKQNGLEIVNVFKNLIAILCGFISVMGKNMISNMITLGIIEIKRILKIEKCHFDNLYYADIIATCTSNDSRNYRYGQSIHDKMLFTETVEGKNSLIGLRKRYNQSILFDLIDNMDNMDKFLNIFFSYLTCQ